MPRGRGRGGFRGGRGGPKVRGGRNQAPKEKRFTEEDFNDEIDDFTTTRDKVEFDKRRENDDDSDIEGVLDLDVDEEGDDDGSDVDSEENEDIAYTPVPGTRKKFIDDDDDEDEEEVDESKWGKKKDYYFTDFVDDELGDSEDEEYAQNEEEEVRRLQEKKAQEVSEDDYDDTFGGIISKLKTAQKENKPKTKRSDTALLESMNKDLEAIDLHNVDTGVSVERVSKDIAGLSREEKLEIISVESPEFTILLNEFGKSLKEIKAQLQPIVSVGKTLPSSNGLIYLQLKYQLLMNYSTNIAFYLMMKAAGKRVKDHPVIDQLFRTKALIDKLGPMDKKIKDQARLLLELLQNGQEQGNEQSTSEPESPKAKSTKRVKESARVNGKTANKKSKKEVPELSSASEESDLDENELEPQSNDPSSEDKFVRYKVKDTKRAKKTTEFTALDDLGDTQAVERLTGQKRKYAAVMNQIEQNENKKKVVVGGDEDIPYKVALKKQKLNDGSAKQTEETFVSYLHEEGKAKKSKKEVPQEDDGADVFSDYSDDDGEEGSEDDEVDASDNEDEFYKSTKAAQMKNKQKKLDLEQERRDAQRVRFTEDTVREGGKRHINYAIRKNKGLAKKAKKENRNSRVKLRNKYDKAKIRRTGQVMKVRDQMKPYGGEVGGIKTNVVRSTKLQ